MIRWKSWPRDGDTGGLRGWSDGGQSRLAAVRRLENQHQPGAHGTPLPEASLPLALELPVSFLL